MDGEILHYGSLQKLYQPEVFIKEIIKQIDQTGQ